MVQLPLYTCPQVDDQVMLMNMLWTVDKHVMTSYALTDTKVQRYLDDTFRTAKSITINSVFTPSSSIPVLALRSSNFRTVANVENKLHLMSMAHWECSAFSSSMSNLVSSQRDVRTSRLGSATLRSDGRVDDAEDYCEQSEGVDMVKHPATGARGSFCCCSSGRCFSFPYPWRVLVFKCLSSAITLSMP